MRTAFSDAFGVILIVYAGHMLQHRHGHAHASNEFVVDGMSLLAAAVIIAVLLSLIFILSHKKKRHLCTMTTSTKQQEFCDDEPWDMMIIPASTDPDFDVIHVPGPNTTSRANIMHTYISNVDRFNASEKQNALQWLPELLLAMRDDDDTTACIQIVNTIHDRFAIPMEKMLDTSYDALKRQMQMNMVVVVTKRGGFQKIKAHYLIS